MVILHSSCVETFSWSCNITLQKPYSHNNNLQKPSSIIRIIHYLTSFDISQVTCPHSNSCFGSICEWERQ